MPLLSRTSTSPPLTGIPLVSLLLVWSLFSLSAGSAPASGADEKLSATEPEFQVNTTTSGIQNSSSVAEHDEGFVVIWRSAESFPNSILRGQLLDEDGETVAAEFQISPSTSGGQSNPSVAAWDDGRFVVAWREVPDVRARLFDSAGLPRGSHFVVQTNTTYINLPSIEVRDDSFLVAWTEDGDGDGRSVSARRYDSDGVALGDAIQLNSYTTGFQGGAIVGKSPDQDFVVTWTSEGSFGDDSDVTSIQMRNIGSGGTLVGTEFQVNTFTTGFAYDSHLDFAEDGSFLVVWTNYGGSPGDDTDSASVLARRFDSAGSAIGSDFQVNSYTTGYQYARGVRTTLDGGFVVTWFGSAIGSSDSEGYAVALHRLDSIGVSVDGDLVVNTLTTGDQAEPAIARSSRGDFLVVWDSEVSAGSDLEQSSVQARFFAAESDIAVSVDNGVDTVTPGGSVVYTVEVSNTGPDMGTGVELLDTLTSELTCDWTSVGSGGATGNTASGSGALAETLRLPPGAAVTYTLDCDVAPGSTGGLVHSADVVAVDQVDANSSNDSAFDFDVLERSTDLGLTLTASSLQVGPGGEVVLTATVTQSGPSASSGARVFDGLPPELAFVSSADCALIAGFVACDIPPLDPGEMASVVYRVAVDPGVLPGMMVDDEAAVLADDDDPNASNDLDGLSLAVVEPLVFQDGFESGDTSSWSTQVP